MLDLYELIAGIPELKGHAPGKNREYVTISILHSRTRYSRAST
jgi:hypothetical protein